MTVLTHCPLCQTSDNALKSFKAQPSGFVREQVGVHDPIKLIHCDLCSFWFFDYRYSDKEIHRLYHNYRDENYIELRSKHKNSYLSRIQDEKNQSSRIFFEAHQFIEKHVSIDDTLSILDYGGNRGELLTFFPGQLFLYDISDHELLSQNIQKIPNLESHKFDLILLSHVLEHVPDFQGLLKTLAGLLDKDRGMLYIEVPYSFYPNPNPNYVYEMIEHVNFFDEISLSKTIRPCFSLHNLEISLLKGHSLIQPYVLRCLASLPKEPMLDFP